MPPHCGGRPYGVAGELEVAIDTAGHNLVVDSVTVLRTEDGGQCGNAALRVWAESAEFADFSFLPS